MILTNLPLGKWLLLLDPCRSVLLFFFFGVVLGHIVPLALLFTGSPMLGAAAAVAAIAGLYCYEHAFVMAPQEIPNS